MAKKYSYQETVEALQKTISYELSQLYNSTYINRIGVTPDTNQYFTEIASRIVLENINEFDKIIRVRRENSYYVSTHCNIKVDLCKTNRHEEVFAKRLTGLEIPEIGLVIDYQVPLKNTLRDKGIGKIDLLSYRDDIKTMYFIELKYKGNQETLLRAILESYTYFKTVDLDKLKEDYINNYNFQENKFISDKNSTDIKIIPAVLVTPGCNAYNELKQMEIGLRPEMRKLVERLMIPIFSLDIKCSKYEI